MKLEEWLVNKNLSIYQFAKRASLSTPTIYNALLGKRVSRRTAVKIEIATDREITVAEILK